MTMQGEKVYYTHLPTLQCRTLKIQGVPLKLQGVQKD
jgi:hypothetical protein